MNKEEIKKQVRKKYGRTAATGSSVAGPLAWVADEDPGRTRGRSVQPPSRLQAG